MFGYLTKILFFLFGILILQKGKYVVRASTVLLPTPAIATDGEPFNLTCAYSGSKTVVGFVWLLNEITVAFLLVPACTPFDNPGPPDSSLYEYSCSDSKRSTFTVKQISNENNGDQWKCATSVPEYQQSVSVLLTVRVAVKSVSLTPPTALTESVESLFKCETSASRPVAAVSWYKESSSGQKQQLINNISETSVNVGSLTKTSSTLKFTPSRNDNGANVYCTAINIPGRTPVKSAAFTLNVHHPPDSPPKIEHYSNTYKIIENQQGSLSCTIQGGNPLATLTWNCYNTGSAEVIVSTNVTKTVTWTASRDQDRSCTCRSSHPVTGTQSVSVSVQVLYPPEVGKLQNQSIAEGKSLTITCPFTVGNPPETSFKWKRTSDDREWTMQDLIIKNVSRNDAVFYTCEVANMMKQTGEEQAVTIPDSESLYLNVWYAATVTHFYVNGFTERTNVTVNENGTVHFICHVDGNPGSAITVQYLTEGKHSTSDTDTKSLEYVLKTATCLDAGIYKCMGSNQYNSKVSVKQLRLFVNCSPRHSPFIQLSENVTSIQHKETVITFTTLAYPEPAENDFEWFRWDNVQWISLTNNAAYQIDISGLQSNLTVKDVKRTSYGKYKLTVKNAVGDYEQIFNLVPAGKPEEPKDVQHVQNLVTETTVTVQWKPGFDNGLEQVFILKYRKASDPEWKSVEIPDSGTLSMNYTVLGLSSGTIYQVVIYASNKLGQSPQSDLIIVRTKDSHMDCSCSNNSNTAIIVGVVLGLIIVMLSVYSSYVTMLLKRKDGNQEQTISSDFIEHANNMQTYANVAYSPNGNGKEQCTDLSESEASEYTTLRQQLRDDKATYDVINAAC